MSVMTVGDLFSALAWASMPEAHVVSRLAALCRKRGFNGRRGQKRIITAAVAESKPPYGMKRKRTIAVETEIANQIRIAVERRGRRRDCDPLVNKGSRASRIARVARRLLISGYRGRPITFSKIQGLRIFITTRYSHYCGFVLCTAPGEWIQLDAPSGTAYWSEDMLSVLSAVLYKFTTRHEIAVSALLRGDKVSFDFHRRMTIVERNGKTTELPWKWTGERNRKASSDEN